MVSLRKKCGKHINQIYTLILRTNSNELKKRAILTIATLFNTVLIKSFSIVLTFSSCL